jgi:hypothetical protein
MRNASSLWPTIGLRTQRGLPIDLNQFQPVNLPDGTFFTRDVEDVFEFATSTASFFEAEGIDLASVEVASFEVDGTSGLGVLRFLTNFFLTTVPSSRTFVMILVDIPSEAADYSVYVPNKRIFDLGVGFNFNFTPYTVPTRYMGMLHVFYGVFRS